jgi:hypothetical protein
MKKIIIISISFLISLISYSNALASGAQVSPSKINLEITNNTSETSLTVFNPSSGVQLFEVYPDDFENNISVNPKSFTLEAGENKKVKINVSASKNIQNSQISTNISIISKPLSDSDFSVGAGIKVPITAIFTETKQINYFYYLAPILALFLILLFGFAIKHPRLLKKVVK